jgi:hypothetical protein
MAQSKIGLLLIAAVVSVAVGWSIYQVAPRCTGTETPPFMVGGTKQAGC